MDPVDRPPRLLYALMFALLLEAIVALTIVSTLVVVRLMEWM